MPGVCVSYLSPYFFFFFVVKLRLAFFSLKSNLPSNPTQSLNFLDLYAVDGIYCSTWYCTGVFNRYSYFTNFWSYDTWLLNSTVPWEYTKVPTKDLRVVYLQFVYPTSGNTEPNKMVMDTSISLSSGGGSPPPYNGGNRAILTNRELVFLKWNFYSKNNFKILTCWLSTLPPSPQSSSSFDDKGLGPRRPPRNHTILGISRENFIVLS